MDGRKRELFRAFSGLDVGCLFADGEWLGDEIGSGEAIQSCNVSTDGGGE
jgi:hypothetical protein